MPKAWVVLVLSLLSLGLFEAVGRYGPLRPLGFMGALRRPASAPVPTPWPTPAALPERPGHVHTRASQVRKLLHAVGPVKGKTLRVAYFADSIIEGDLISSTLRHKIQQIYGGQGIGWVGMAPIDAAQRDDLQQSFSPNWERHAVFKPGWKGQPCGPGGQAWDLASPPGSVHFSPGRGQSALPPATLWYGPVDAAGAKVAFSADGQPGALTLDGKLPLNRIPLSRAPAQDLQIDVQSGPGQMFYGVSFDQGSGLDCFSTRGSHGGPLQRLDLGMLKELQAQRGYGLVLVQYGTNALLMNKDPEYKWYRRELAAGLRQLQAGLPGAAMVLVSATDRAVRLNGEWESDPFLPGLLAAQKAAASDVGIPFINAFDLMGGPGTMKAWAEATPRLAEHDYTHFSALGAERFAESLWQSLRGLGRQGLQASKP